MTWEEFVNSDYNNDDNGRMTFENSGSSISIGQAGYVTYNGSMENKVLPTDLIEADRNYVIDSGTSPA